MIRFVGRSARATVNAGLILAVVIGGPYLLLRFFGSPLPTSLPSQESLAAWVDEPLTGAHLRSLISLVIWAAWGLFVYVIAIETYAAIRRIRAPRIRLAAPLHSVAAGLVGATAAAVSGPAAHAAAPPASEAIAATVSGYDAIDESQPEPAAASYQIATGDRMADIAGRFLGEPTAFHRLTALNPELERRDHRFPDHIEPGWTLRLPPDAHDRGPRRHATGTLLTPTDETHTATSPPAVASDPSPAVSAIPAPEVIPPAPAPVDVPANPGSTYPYPVDVNDDSGTEVPGDTKIGAMSGAGLLAGLVLLALQAERRRQTQHRRPGQRLPNPRGGTTERDLRVAETPADIERLDLALRQFTTSLAEASSAPDVVGVRVIGGDVQVLLARDHDDPPEPWLDEGSHWVLPGTTPLAALPSPQRPLPTLTAVGSRAGRHLLLDVERAGTLSITGDPHRAAELLRYMICELACNTWSEDSEITIAGFTDQEAQWLVALNPGRIRVAPSVADTIIQLRRRAIANRQALDALGLDDTVNARIQGVAADAWTPHVLLVARPGERDVAGLAALDQVLAQSGRCGVAVVATVPTPIGPTTITVSPDTTLTVTTPGLRTTTGAAGLPLTELEKLAEILRLARTTELPVAAEASPGPQLASDVDSSDASSVELSDADDRVHGLYDVSRWTEDAASTLADDGGKSSARLISARFDPTLDDDLDTWARKDANPPRFGVLGPVEVHTSGTDMERRKDFHAEIAIYLAAHPRGADRWELAEALWPMKEIAESTVRVSTARLRRWLGEAEEGQPWLLDADKGVYRLRPGFLLDWDLLRRLTARARKRDEYAAADLHAALALVRGRPLQGAENPSNGRNQYTWLGASSIAPPHVQAVIIDAAHQLAQLYLDDGDTANARWAVQQAWTADPDRAHDEPWLDLIRAEYIDGNRAALHELQNELVRARDGEVPEDLDPTTYSRLQSMILP